MAMTKGQDDRPEERQSLLPRANDDDDDTGAVDGYAATRDNFPSVNTEEGIRTPLLPTDLPPEVLPSKAFQYKVTLLCAAFIFIVDVAVFLMDPPFQKVVEDVICHIHHPDHELWQNGIDRRCKAPDVQKKMAMVKSAVMIPQLLCPILVQVPYGRVADAYGRRLVMSLSVIGVALGITSNIIILSFPEIFSIWLMIPASLFLLIGGGPSMTTAMIWTMLADVTPAAERAGVYYMIMAVVLVLTATLYPLAGWLMTFSPWVPLWGGFVTLWIGVASSFFLPETGTLRAKADEREQQQQQQHSEDADAHPATEAATTSKASGGLITRAWRVLKRDAVQIWRFIITSRQIMLLCLLNSIHNPFSVSMVVYGLQYMTARFELDWSTATYVLTISRITSVIFLLFLLPAVSVYMLQGFGMNPYKRDLYLFRFSTILLTAGCFMMALAVQPWMMITSQIVYGMSSGYAPQARALVTALVEPHMLATLNTTLSTLEGIMALIAAPCVGWLLGKGLEWGGLMVGLPYMVLAAIAFVAMVTACLLRVPKEMMGRAGNYV